MKSLIENVFRSQLKRLSERCGYGPNANVAFVYTNEDFKYKVGISTRTDYVEQFMDTITEKNIKRMVDGLIHRFEETTGEIRTTDYGVGNTMQVRPYLREWNGEIRDTGERAYPREWDEVQESVEVCNG